jgi:SAM-dependent methyltransferase
MRTDKVTADDVFFREYTSEDAIRKYTRATAGYGISHLLENEYRAVYLDALARLPAPLRSGPLSILEFGCGAGMNLVNLVSFLTKQGLNVERAIGADFSPVLIQAAQREAQNYLASGEREKIEFCVGLNETLGSDLAAALDEPDAELRNSFEFILGVNTIRYCHRAGKGRDCSQQIYHLLAPGGVCVVIDMNDRFPAFRSALKKKFGGEKENEEECYLPSLAEYTAPFAQTGFEILRSENFCWIPHSAGPGMTRLLRTVSPLLNLMARSRAMRSLVVARKPGTA